MYPVRRLALVAPVVLVLVSGCGDSLATRSSDYSVRATATTEAPARTPFCEAVAASEQASDPLVGLGVGQRLEDVSRVVQQVRNANEQVVALAPQEIRADVERTTAFVEQQLRALEANGGDTLAVARDPAVARSRSDPGYTAANRRVTDYVRRACPA